MAGVTQRLRADPANADPHSPECEFQNIGANSINAYHPAINDAISNP